jgi:hypothetical protein
MSSTTKPKKDWSNLETARVVYWLKEEEQWQPIIKEALEEYKKNRWGTGNIFGKVAMKHINKFDTKLWFDLIACVLAYKVNWPEVIEALEK